MNRMTPRQILGTAATTTNIMFVGIMSATINNSSLPHLLSPENKSVYGLQTSTPSATTTYAHTVKVSERDAIELEDEFHKEIINFYIDLSSKQESLGKEFQEVLNKNRKSLYVRS